MGKKDSSNFGQLLNELETMKKSLDVDDDLDADLDLENLGDDEKIKAAAEADELKEGEDLTLRGDDDDDDLMGKALSVTLETGEKLEAIDGTKLVKSLMAQMETSENDMAKAMGLAIGNIQKVADKLNTQAKTIVEQGALIKSLQETMKQIGDKPGGRRTVVSVHEKRSGDELHKSEDLGEDGMARGEFLAKALTAQKEGRLTGLDISKAESCLNSGLEVPEHIVKKVIGSASV